MMLKNLPNFITLCNLFLGCIGILHFHRPEIAVYCLYGAAVCDFFDGLIARWLNAHSAVGKDLDSLADVVSFGVLPGFIMYHLIGQSINQTEQMNGLAYFAFLIPVLSAWRLARFNHDTRQTDRFIGLPTPALGMMVAGLYFLSFQYPAYPFWHNTYALIGLTILLAYLLNSPLPLIALKFKTWTWNSNEFRWLLIASAAVVILFFKTSAPVFIIPLFIVVSLAENIFKKKPL
jgi:CDP-diacylglycerol--serine O-phosphatidyltransferase